MAQDGIIRYGILQDLLKDMQVINTLTGEYPFAEHILIHVGSRKRICVQTFLSGENAGEQRPVGISRTERDPWLDQSEAFRHDPLLQINDRPVHWVSHRTYHLFRHSDR